MLQVQSPKFIKTHATQIGHGYAIAHHYDIGHRLQHLLVGGVWSQLHDYGHQNLPTPRMQPHAPH